MQDLIKLSDAARMLQEAKSMTEVIDFKDKAEALKHYFKKKRVSLQMRNDAEELIIRAKRHLGVLLEKSKKPRGNPTLSNSVPQDGIGTPEAGLITENQARKWRLMAKVPEEILEKYFGTTREKEEEITSNAVLKIAKPPKPKKGKKVKPPDPPDEEEANTKPSSKPWDMRAFAKLLTDAQEMLVDLAKQKGNTNNLGKVFRNPTHETIHSALQLALTKTREWYGKPIGKEKGLYD